MKQLLMAACASALLLSAACVKAPSTTKAASPSVKAAELRKPAPDFELKDIDGRTVKLSDLKGKVVMINFWATWCGPCKIEIPWFMEFERKYKDQGFALIGIATDEEGWEVVKPYVADKEINYRIVMSSPLVEQLYGGVEALPMTFLIDKEGKVASIHTGLVSKSDYEDEIKELLK